MVAKGLWLSRSGQAWKARWSTWSAIAGFGLLALAIVGPRRGSAWTGMLALFCFSANVALPLTIRCGVCGLQLETCVAARRLSRDRRLKWIESLNECPVCHGDGAVSDQATAEWRTLGLEPEPSYWSGSRLLLALVAACAFIGGAVAFGIKYRIR
jgi:hypothetical protein